MKFFTSLSIRGKLLFLIVASVLPAAGIILYSGFAHREHEIASSKREILYLAQSMAAQQKQVEGSTRQMLAMLAQLPEVQRLDANACSRTFRDIQKRNPMYAALNAATSDGIMFAASMPFTPGSINIADRKHFRDAVKTRDFSAGEYIFGRLIQVPTILYSYPVLDKNRKLIAVISAAIHLDKYKEFMEQLNLPTGSITGIADHKNITLLRFPERKNILPGTPLPLKNIQAVPAGKKEGFYEGIGRDNVSRIYAYKKLSLYDHEPPYLTMYVGIDKNLALHDANMELLYNLLFLTMVTVLAMLLAWIAGNSMIVNPVNRLVSATKQFGEGKLHVRTNLPDRGDELGRLAKSFDAMAVMLETEDMERKKAEEALKQSDELLKLITDNMSDMIRVIDFQGNNQYVSPSHTKGLGYAMEERVGKSSLDIVHPDDVERILKQFTVGFQNNQAIRAEYRVRHADGHYVWLDTVGDLLRDNQGNVSAAVMSSRDISERKRSEAELERSRDFIENVEDACFEMDLSGNLTFHNESFLKTTGYTYDEYMALSRWDRHPTREEAKRVFKIYDDVYKTGIPAKSVEYKSLRKDGVTPISEVSISLVLDKSGDAIGFRGIGRDITSRKRVEETLRESEERFRLAFSTSPDSININRLSDGLYVDINDGFTRLTGFTREDAIGRTSREISIWCDPEDRQKLVDGLREKGYYDNLEAQFRRKDGSVTTALMSANILILNHVPHILSVTRDISDRRSMEKQILILNERILTATRAAQMGIWDWDIESNRLTWDEQIYALYGQKRAHFAGSFEGWQNVIHPDDRSSCVEAVNQALRGEKNYNTEFRVVWPDGSIHFIRATGEVHRDKSGKPTRLIGVNYDITDIKSAELEKTKLQDQYLQSQKMELVGRLAGGVAHDFNNMLGVIIGHAEMAMEGIGPAHSHYEDLKEICKAVDRSADLTRQLLAFARKQTVSPKVLDLNDTIEGMLKMLRRLIGEDIALNWQPKANLWPVKMDPSQIDQILANLSVNARDAIAGVGKVNIETENVTFDERYCISHMGSVPGMYSLLAVSDNGCGMSKDILGQIFEPFFTTKEQGKGTGLGLSTVYGIVKQNNGFINVYSEPGLGTTFKVYLPRYAGTAERVDVEERQSLVIGGRETVLIVEDEPSILNLCKVVLGKLGYEVVSAGSPKELIHLAEAYTGEIKLVITDVVMPEMNGRELSEKLLSLYPGMKCLFMSGYTADTIARHGVLDDGVNFIQKPFSTRNFANKVREVLDQR